ncbi:eyes absent homolog 3 isoform X2 [Xenopus laevis]|nr:eyes absent homolog 3 isoform X2 [Xenopus laevis]XP_018104966.1 eyes absent homolog 3 isoform X2 [Xenopus laevis]XP_041439866.1 eyes absent homolog 3 isoform X2 [Xenopus laevis]XP_041439867.1 eyes absent homolog 3 isoform X2 [Xenopus laevis]
MQDSGEEGLSQVGNNESSDRKAEPSSNMSSNQTMPSEILPCADYILRANDYASQIYPAKSYTHILSVPVAETVATYTGQTQYQTLQPSQPYTVYPQASPTYGLPPFGALWPGIKSESGLIQTPSPPAALTSSGVTSSQSSPVLYSYPVQASSTNASAMSSPSTIANISIPTVTSISSQEYPSYTILGQNQYPQCYPNQGFPSAASSSNAEANSATPLFPTDKSENTVPAQASQRPLADNAAGQPMMRAMGSQETEEQNKKAVPVKNRGKGKKADASSPQHGDLERVFLWDLDETIIIFHSLLTGSYAQKYGKDPTLVVESGLAMEEMIFEVADTHLFFNDLEECDQVHVEDVASDDNGQDLSNYSFTTDGFNGTAGGRNHTTNAGVQGGMDWMRKLAFRYRKVTEVYEKYKNNVSGLLSPQRRDSLQRLRANIEALTDGWLGTALKCLLLLQSRKNCVNVLITTTQLVPALAKVLLYGLGEVFPIDNIYSATKIGKESCFERIVTRFGKKVTYVVIGDGRDEEMAAKQHNMPFWRITNHNDLISLHQALELDFL